MLAEGSTLGIAASLFAIILFAWPLLYKCLQVGDFLVIKVFLLSLNTAAGIVLFKPVMSDLCLAMKYWYVKLAVLT